MGPLFSTGTYIAEHILHNADEDHITTGWDSSCSWCA